jgi:hypothetical protein
MRWRSAVVSFGALGAIISVGDAVAPGDAVGVTIGSARGEGDAAGPMSQFEKLVDADYRCPPPSNPNV